MRILVAVPGSPFQENDFEILGRELCRQLNLTGHRADLMVTPSASGGQEYAAYIASFFAPVRRDGSGNRIDRLISLGAPAFVLRHPFHVCWLGQRLGDFYETWPSFLNRQRGIKKVSARLKRFILTNFDNYFLQRNVNRLFVMSPSIQEKIKRHNHVLDSLMLRPPPLAVPAFSTVPGDYLFAVARDRGENRLETLLRGLARTKVRVNVRIAGDESTLGDLRRLSGKLKLEKRIRFLVDPDWAERQRQLAGCRLLYHAPLAEDFSLLANQSGAAGKPLLTRPDSGFAAALSDQDGCGIILFSDEAELAAILDRLWLDKPAILTLGRKARRFSLSRHWPGVVEKLTKDELTAS